jgi:hypothetical protein
VAWGRFGGGFELDLDSTGAVPHSSGFVEPFAGWNYLVKGNPDPRIAD